MLISRQKSPDCYHFYRYCLFTQYIANVCYKTSIRNLSFCFFVGFVRCILRLLISKFEQLSKTIAILGEEKKWVDEPFRLLFTSRSLLNICLILVLNSSLIKFVNTNRTN